LTRGVELLDIDSTGLLEGTGTKAPHIKIRSLDDLEDPASRILIEEAARRTPRA
jgi:hypothetical protein